MKPSYMNLFVIDNGDIVQMDDIIAAMNNDRATVTTDVYVRNTVASIYTDGESGSVSYYRLDIMADGMPVKSIRLDGGETQFDLAKVGPELPMRYYDITATAYSKYGRVMGTGNPAPWFNGTSLPKCEPMTLRFRFSKSDYAPVDPETGTSVTALGTWKKVEPCTENIWDWTCEDTSWENAFKSVFISSDNIADVIDAGDTSALTNCKYLFGTPSGNKSYLGHVCWFETKNVTVVQSMFLRCFLLKTIPFFDLSNVTNAIQFLYFCEQLLAIPPFDIRNVIEMASFIADCHAIQKVPMLDTKNVTNMLQVFMNCKSLKTVPMYDTSNVTTMRGMFAGSGIEKVPHFDTSKVTNMYQMFAVCNSLVELPELDLSNVTDMGRFAKSCGKIKSVPHYDTHNVTNMKEAFVYCSQLEHIPKFDTSNVTDMSYAFEASGLVDVPKLDTKSVTIFNGTFSHCYQLKSVPSLDTSNAVEMNAMFQHCHNLEFVGSFDASSATTIERMYFCCEKLKRVNYMPVKDNCNMSRVFDTYVEGQQRQYASSLEEIPNWDFSKASNLDKVFRGCTCLKDIPDMGVPVNATTCSEMFKGCTNIETGMARAYSNLSAGSKIATHTDVFTDCGTATAGGMADRASIPVSWGGDQK